MAEICELCYERQASAQADLQTDEETDVEVLWWLCFECTEHLGLEATE